MPALPDSASPSEVVSRVCVLMFHRVVDRLDEPHDIAPSQLEELLASLSSCKRLDDPGDPFSPSSGRGCLLTFDDATADHFAVAEILGRAGVRGVFYVPTGKLGGDGHLTAAQIIDVAAMGHTIGSHCVSHRTADRMSRPALAAELAESKAYLEDLLGHEVGALALPGGVVTKPAPVLAATPGIRRCGSLAGVSTVRRRSGGAFPRYRSRGTRCGAVGWRRPRAISSSPPAWRSRREPRRCCRGASPNAYAGCCTARAERNGRNEEPGGRSAGPNHADTPHGRSRAGGRSRMRVLVSAFACDPTEGSEPGAGWAWARAAAVEHDVWLMTRPQNAGRDRRGAGPRTASPHDRGAGRNPAEVDELDSLPARDPSLLPGVAGRGVARGAAPPPRGRVRHRAPRDVRDRLDAGRSGLPA